MTQEEFNAMLQVAISQGLFGYYTSEYSNEEMDQAVGDVINGNVVIPSSTPDSVKKFRVKVDDAGILSAEEVTT